jgi:hypothetical protein
MNIKTGAKIELGGKFKDVWISRSYKFPCQKSNLDSFVTQAVA